MITLGVLGASARRGPPGLSPHRYWRILITANNGNTATAIQELRMLVSGENQAGVGKPGSASASSIFVGTGSNPPGAAFNAETSNPDLAWSTATGAVYPHWLQWDFGVGVSRRIEVFEIFPQDRSDLLTRSPKDFAIQWSDDGVNFTTARAYTNVTGWALRVSKTFATT